LFVKVNKKNIFPRQGIDNRCLGLYICDNKKNVANEQPCHENHIGYHLGNQAIINNWSEEELLNQVINAANNGKLQIIK